MWRTVQAALPVAQAPVGDQRGCPFRDRAVVEFNARTSRLGLAGFVDQLRSARPQVFFQSKRRRPQSRSGSVQPTLKSQPSVLIVPRLSRMSSKRVIWPLAWIARSTKLQASGSRVEMQRLRHRLRIARLDRIVDGVAIKRHAEVELVRPRQVARGERRAPHRAQACRLRLSRAAGRDCRAVTTEICGLALLGTGGTRLAATHVAAWSTRRWYCRDRSGSHRNARSVPYNSPIDRRAEALGDTSRAGQEVLGSPASAGRSCRWFRRRRSSSRNSARPGSGRGSCRTSPSFINGTLSSR